ncbi:MAG: 4,5-dihydroxyphthalate decarboxylase [Rhodospirillales bacterium]|nr:4,5-dihydroxyphthalate decarboxylase [Rhodospirillales bacterium]
MADLELTGAFGDYDHLRDLALGRVRPNGIALRVLNFNVEEIFFRFHDRGEWEVSELSMGMYCSARSRSDDRFIALPVFPSRVFRHSAFYVRADGPIQRPEDLAGRTVGVPQWSQTATIYARGFLSDTVGITLASIRWVQAGVNDPGRDEPSTLKLPAGIELVSMPDCSLNDLLLDGRIDALISARPPKAFTAGDPRLVRLFPDYPAAEAAYFAKTGIFPIMHTVAIRRDIYEANRWIARNLYLAFEEAKARSLARLGDLTAAHVPLPWGVDLFERAERSVFKGGPFWPYGLAPNRVTLEAFLRFAHEQGVCHRRLAPEELFAPEALAEIRV